MRVPSLLLLVLVCRVPAAEYATVILPAAGERFREANYALWVPEGVLKLKGLILHQHGCGEGAQNAGRTATANVHWQALAAKWDCALLGASLWPKDQCADWCNPVNGTERAFLSALRDLAEAAQRTELVAVPWVIWGHSGGGAWAYRMYLRHPERMAAVVLQSAAFSLQRDGASRETPDWVGASPDVPVLVHVGLKEQGDARFGGLYDEGVALFRDLRAREGRVTLAVDPASGHESGNARYLSIPWIDACLALRLGGAESPVTEPYPGFEAAVWLPSAKLVPVWREFVATGDVRDRTPPPAPVQLELEEATAGRVVMRWRAPADLESGIKTFRVYRDGQRLAPYTAPGRQAGQTTELFREPNYNDTPNRPLAEMRYVDTTARDGRHEYQVTSVNWSDLESKKSGVLVVER